MFFLSGIPRCTTLTTPLSQPHRAKSTLTIVKAADDAPRRVSTPILFLAAKTFNQDTKARDLYAAFVQRFSSQGYESILLDLDPDGIERKRSSRDILDAYEADMTSLLQAASPPPPVLMAQSLSCLIAEQYASSHPVTSLLLLNPPLSPYRAHQDHPSLLPTPFDQEDLDFSFPCRVIFSLEDLYRLESQDVPEDELHRIEHAAEQEQNDELLERIMWEKVEEEGPEEMQKWLEEDCEILSQQVTSEEGLEFDQDSDQLEEDLDVDFEGIVEEQDDQQGTIVSSRSVSRSASNLPPTSPAGRFLVAGNRQPSWLTTSEHYIFTGSKKMPLTLDESHLRETFNRGGGKGGQAINKNKSRCDLLHLPTGVIVRCQEERALARNRVLARRRMSIILEEGLRAAAPPRGGQGARLANLSVREKAREKERKRKLNKKKKQKKKANLKLAADEELENIGEVESR